MDFIRIIKKITNLNIIEEIVDLNYQLLRTQLILEYILNNNSSLNKPDANQMKSIDDNAITSLQKKYPNLIDGLEYK
jgi:hypothetical protein